MMTYLNEKITVNINIINIAVVITKRQITANSNTVTGIL